MTGGLLPERETGLLRTALDTYTVDTVHELLGPVGQAALGRSDLTGAERALRGVESPTATLTRLFLLGRDVDAADVRRALHPLPLDAAVASGLLEVDVDTARALVDVRPYAEQGATLPGRPATGAQWWVVSDLGGDVRPGPLADTHVLGVGTASLTLAQAVPRDPVGTALDIGTGSGVQALHLAQHANRVVATDVSARALRMAATTAALSGQRWDLRAGSLLEPVAAERFDLVVANPPFVVSPGRATVSGWQYRDGAVAGDAVSEQLVRTVPAVLAPGGSAHVLANWLVPRSGEWRERIGSWVVDTGCDAWVWQREVAEPGEYVALWLRDSGLAPGTGDWRRRYDGWLDWFASVDAVAVGMGLVSLWRTDYDDPAVVLEDVPQALHQPVGPQLPAWHRRARWLARNDDDAVLAARLRAAEGIVLDRTETIGDRGWRTAATLLRQSDGMCWQVDVDDSIAAVLAACDGTRPVTIAVAVLAATLGRATSEIAAALVPVLRDLVQRGFLLPDGDP